MKSIVRMVMLLAMVSICLVGCDGGNNNPSGGGNNTGGNNTGGDSTGNKSDSLSYGGQKYKTVKIGNQTWMAENLNYSTSTGSLCYGESPSNCTKYGRLYTWEMAKTVCPSGWHLPSRREWGILAIAAGGTGEYGTGGDAGYNLKSKDGWNQNGGGADSFGFSALSGGEYRLNIVGDRGDWVFEDIGTNGHWWTATDYGEDLKYAYSRGMEYNGGFVIEETRTLKNWLFCSVRCLKTD
jgi:uncharacterized protein (TIGR02145 family)